MPTQLVHHRLADDVGGGLRVQQQGNNQAVQTQDFSENQDQDHTHEQSWLLSGASDTSVTNNTDGKAGSQTGQTNGQAGTQLDEAGVQGLLLFQRVGHQHGHHQAVNGNDTGHNDGHDVLDQQVGSQHGSGTNADTGLSSAVRRTETGENDGGGTADGTKEWRVNWAMGVSKGSKEGCYGVARRGKTRRWDRERPMPEAWPCLVYHSRFSR